MNFITPDTLKAWTGTPQTRRQIDQLERWGYRQGRDFWVRSNSTLAVKATLLHSSKSKDAPTEPDFSCLAADKKTSTSRSTYT